MTRSNPLDSPSPPNLCCAYSLPACCDSPTARAPHVDSCPPHTDCLGGAAPLDQLEGANSTTVRLKNGAGQTSVPLELKTATASQIETAFRSIRDTTYSAARVTSVSVSNMTAAWTFELTTPYGACADGGGGSSYSDSPPLSAALSARVTLSIEILSRASCLRGGVDVSLVSVGANAMAGGTANVTAVYIPWDSSAHAVTSSLNSLLGVSSADDGVLVRRGGDGHASTTFTITSLRAGTRPLLAAVASSATNRATSQSALAQVTYALDGTVSCNSTTDVAVLVERVAEAAIELLPLPGRYLSAPSDQPVITLRLKGQTTARCAAPNWDMLHVGCFEANATRYADGYATRPGAERSFPRGFSLERCAHYCLAYATAPKKAVGFAAQEDMCTCLAALPTAEALPSSNCSTTCSAVDRIQGSQMCGNTAPNSRASIYALPARLSSTGTSLPCSFKFAAAQTATVSGADKTVAAVNETLTISGKGFRLGTGAPTVDACSGRPCVVTSYTVTSIVCRMPDCPEQPNTPIRVHVPPFGYAAGSASLMVRGVLSVTGA